MCPTRSCFHRGNKLVPARFLVPFRLQHLDLPMQHQMPGTDRISRSEKNLVGGDFDAIGGEYQNLELQGIDRGEQRYISQ